MRRALVAGGAGLIGSHLCEYLLGEGYEVIAVDNFVSSSRGNVGALSGRDGFSFVEHDVLDLLPDVGSVDEVYHLASPASPVFFEELAEEIAMVNSVGTWNLLEFARDQGATFLLASTSEIYGDPEQHPQGESYPGNVHTIGLRAPYDESKRFAETLTYLAAQKHRVDARIVRIFNTFGPRMRIDDGRAVVEFIMRALQSEPLVVFGDGTQTRSWCFVTDMVVGIHRAMTVAMDPALPINLGNPREMTIREVAEQVIAAAGGDSTIEYAPLPPDDPVRRCPDIGRARELLDWEPQVAIEDGLAATIAWYRDQLGEPG